LSNYKHFPKTFEVFKTMELFDNWHRKLDKSFLPTAREAFWHLQKN